jgi:pimeloyl-ACP methyl ester carboxylesterase
MKKIILFSLYFIIVFSLSGFCCDDSNIKKCDYDLSLPGISLREGVTATIHCRVFVNPKHYSSGLSILAIHGAGHTAATWENLAKAIFSYSRIGSAFADFIAIDMPGHGQSGLPDNMLFGDMNVNDYVSIVINVMEELRHKNLKPTIIIAHSMGTMVAQMLQQTLIDQGTNLRKKFGVSNVILMAPTVPNGLPYQIMDSGAGIGIIGQFVTYGPELGTYIYFPEYVWPMMFFSNRMGIPAQGIPSTEEIIAKGYNSPEASMFSLQIVGVLPYYTRPVINESIFGSKNGTALYLVGYENDILLLPSEGKTLFKYLTGTRNYLSRYIFIEGTDAVHDYHLFQAGKLVEKIFGNSLWCFGRY